MITPPSFRTFREHRALIRLALELGRELTPREDKQWTRARRLRDARYVMSAGQVAWVLVDEPRFVTAAIRTGQLPAEPEELPDGRWRWRILRSDVLRYVARLEGDEESVERIREAEVEGREGSWR